MKIEVGKEYKTRGGYLATVIYELSGNEKRFPFVVCIKYSDGDEQVITATRQGRTLKHEQSLDDLVSPAPKKIKVEGWVNVYPEQFDFSTLYSDKKLADQFASEKRIACKRIEFEVEEGEGL